jgi:hypothetical protein
VTLLGKASKRSSMAQLVGGFAQRPELPSGHLSMSRKKAGKGEVRNDDPIDRSFAVVFTRWWGMGLFPLARVAPAGHLAWSAK